MRTCPSNSPEAAARIVALASAYPQWDSTCQMDGHALSTRLAQHWQLPQAAADPGGRSA